MHFKCIGIIKLYGGEKYVDLIRYQRSMQIWPDTRGNMQIWPNVTFKKVQNPKFQHNSKSSKHVPTHSNSFRAGPNIYIHNTTYSREWNPFYEEGFSYYSSAFKWEKDCNKPFIPFNTYTVYSFLEIFMFVILNNLFVYSYKFIKSKYVAFEVRSCCQCLHIQIHFCWNHITFCTLYFWINPFSMDSAISINSFRTTPFCCFTICVECH